MKAIPLEVLFACPKKTNPRISYDGIMLAYIAPANGIKNIWVKTLGKDDDTQITNQKKRNIDSFFWSYDNEHLFYFQDNEGDENYHLHMVHMHSKQVVDVTPFDGVRVDFLAYEKAFPSEMLIVANSRDKRFFDAYRFDLETKKLTLLGENSGNVIRWNIDSNNKLRAMTVANEDATYDVLVRDSENSEWRKIITWTMNDNMNDLFGFGGDRVVGFNKNGDKLYVIDSRNSPTSRLVAVDVGTGNYEVLAEDEQYDVDSVYMNNETRDVQAVVFFKERKEWVFFDKEMEKDFEEIKKLDSGDIDLCDRSIDDKRWIVSFNKANGPETFWMFDREAKEATFLYCARPELHDYELAQVEPVSYKTRDNVTIHGYLTCPVGQEKKELPLILLVHGGPWMRDYLRHDPTVQFFANRGYAILQVNYRGSTGYGKKLLKLGDGEFGAKMHDDLIDAVNWAIENDIADSQKIAIYGESYGGYAALVGAAFTPDVFCCAVDICGPSDWVTAMRAVPPYWSSFLPMLKIRVGDPDTQEALLKSRSPLFKADQIKIPMMVVQGANDVRVKKTESEQIVEALKKNGVVCEYMIFEDEGHGICNEKNRLKLYGAVEKFFKEHLFDAG